jgi:molecular chaperone GrpE
MANIPINDDDNVANPDVAESSDARSMDEMSGVGELRKLREERDSLFESLLPVIDNFERALAVDPAKTDAASILKGMQIIHDQWMDVLKSQDVEEVAPEPGTPFDPTRHEALMQQPSDKYADPTVVQLLQKGYMLHGRTLRPAGVAVSRGT